MNKIVNVDAFVEFQQIVCDMMGALKGVENDIFKDVEEKYNLTKFDEIPDGSNEEILNKYLKMYDELNSVVQTKDIEIMKGHTAINDIVDMMNYLKKVTTKDYLESIITKHQDDSSKIKDRINQLVDKMVEIEEDIFQKNEEKYRIEAEERKQQFLKKKDKLLSLKVIQPTHIPSFSISKSISPSQFHSKHVFDDSQLNVIFQSMDILKKVE
ncbi:hypothetical protein QTN25_007684 [Entamoeba marina]